VLWYYNIGILMTITKRYENSKNSTRCPEVLPTYLETVVIMFLVVHVCIIMYNADIPRDDVVFGTAVGSIVGSLICGLVANLPFTMAPGLGLSAYFSYGLVQGQDLPWQGCLTCCTIAGMIMFLLAITNLSDVIMKIIPNTIKVATVVGMGLLLTMIGMQKINIVVPSNDESIVRLGDMDTIEVWISLLGLTILGTLSYWDVKGSILIGILTVTVIIWTKDNTWPDKYVSHPGEKNFDVIFAGATSFDLINKKYVGAIASFMVVGIFDVSGVLFGLSRMSGLQNRDTGEIPGSKWAFTAAAVGTIVAAMFGCSPIIPAIESAAGLKEGGKTGLTSVTSACWFALAMFLTPLFGNIPVEATSPVLILLGAAMMGEASEINWYCMYQALPAFLCLTIMPFTFSIPNGIIFGTGFLVVLYISTGQFMSATTSGQEDEESLRRIRQERRPSSINVAIDAFEAIKQPHFKRKTSSLYLHEATITNL